MEKAEQGGWSERDLAQEKGAYNGVRWWAEWALKVFGKIAPSGAMAFPARIGEDAEERRKTLLAAAEKVSATFVMFGATRCRVVKGLETAAYRGVGLRSPVLLAEGVSPEMWVDFAKAVCSAAQEERAVVYPAEGGALWWVEKKEKAPEKRKTEESKEKKASGIREFIAQELRRWEEDFRSWGRFVVARVQVEDWGAPEGVFRGGWMTLHKQQGRNGVRFALRWEKKGGGFVAEQVLVASGAQVEEIAELVEGIPGAVCREVQVAPEVTGDGRWLEEAFGEHPEGEPVGEWSLVEAGCVEPPRPSVFGWHDRFFPIRTRDVGK